MDASPAFKLPFFMRIKENDTSFESLSTVFACSISYSKKNGSEISAKLKIVDHKLIIFKVILFSSKFNIYFPFRTKKPQNILI